MKVVNDSWVLNEENEHRHSSLARFLTLVVV
jgi:hypothetical protein